MRHSGPYAVEMDYTAAADKFKRESDILQTMLDGTEAPSRQTVELTLGQAKRVRNASTVLVRELAQERDELQP